MTTTTTVKLSCSMCGASDIDPSVTHDCPARGDYSFSHMVNGDIAKLMSDGVWRTIEEIARQMCRPCDDAIHSSFYSLMLRMHGSRDWAFQRHSSTDGEQFRMFRLVNVPPGVHYDNGWYYDWGGVVKASGPFASARSAAQDLARRSSKAGSVEIKDTIFEARSPASSLTPGWYYYWAGEPHGPYESAEKAARDQTRKDAGASSAEAQEAIFEDIKRAAKSYFVELDTDDLAFRVVDGQFVFGKRNRLAWSPHTGFTLLHAEDLSFRYRWESIGPLPKLSASSGVETSSPVGPTKGIATETSEKDKASAGPGATTKQAGKMVHRVITTTSTKTEDVLKMSAATLLAEYEKQLSAKNRLFRRKSTADAVHSSDGLPHFFDQIFTFAEFFDWVTRGETVWMLPPDNSVSTFVMG